MYYGGIFIAACIDAGILVTYLYMRFSRFRRDRKRGREETRRAIGRNIGTIASTIHTRKQAEFVTVDGYVDFASDSDSWRIKPGSWVWNRRSWRRKIENIANRVGMTFGTSFWNAKLSTAGEVETQQAQGFHHELSIRPSNTDLHNFHLSQEHIIDVDDVIIPQPPTPLARSRANSEAQPAQSKRRPSVHVAKQRNNVVQYSPHLSDLLLGFSRAQDGKDLTLNFRFESLSLRLPSGKTILNGITGHIVPGRVTVIMGPSGAGKSTLMNVLMGKLKRTGGKLLINNREVEMHNYKKVRATVC